MNVLDSCLACSKCSTVAIGTNISPLHIVLTALQFVLMAFGHADILIIVTKTHHCIKILIYSVLDLAPMTCVPSVSSQDFLVPSHPAVHMGPSVRLLLAWASA